MSAWIGPRAHLDRDRCRVRGGSRPGSPSFRTRRALSHVSANPAQQPPMVATRTSTPDMRRTSSGVGRPSRRCTDCWSPRGSDGQAQQVRRLCRRGALLGPRWPAQRGRAAPREPTASRPSGCAEGSHWPHGSTLSAARHVAYPPNGGAASSPVSLGIDRGCLFGEVTAHAARRRGAGPDQAGTPQQRRSESDRDDRACQAPTVTVRCFDSVHDDHPSVGDRRPSKNSRIMGQARRPSLSASGVGCTAGCFDLHGSPT